MNSVHYHTEIACSEQVSYAYFVSLFYELENHLNTTSLTSWKSPGSDVEAVEVSGVSLQQEIRNLETCNSMF